MLYNYEGCKEQLLNLYSDKLRNVPFEKIQFGVDTTIHQRFTGKRPIFMGFKGSLSVNNKKMDMTMSEIFNERQRYVQYAHDNCECYVESFSHNENEMNQLIYFLQLTLLSLFIYSNLISLTLRPISPTLRVLSLSLFLTGSRSAGRSLFCCLTQLQTHFSLRSPCILRLLTSALLFH